MPNSWDVIGYSAYFTEIITDGDLAINDLGHYYNIIDTYKNSSAPYQFVWLEDGGIITKYTCGWTILNAPFLTIGHFVAGWIGYPQDGFSTPYQIAIKIASFFYVALGLFLSRKILLQFFSDKLTAALLIIGVLGTNLLDMSFVGIGLVHGYLFALYPILILLTQRFYQTKKTQTAILIGIVLGVMTLTRPTEILAAIIPLFYGVDSFKSFSIRFKYFFKTPLYLWSIISFISIYSVQLAYWKYTTDHFLFFSYKNPGEGLDLDNPHLWNLLFSFRKGWLLYTPIMIFSFIGLYKMYKYHKELFWSVGVFFLLNLYVVSSWSNWWYAASFSSRPLVQIYSICLLLIGFAFYKMNKGFRIFSAIICSLFIILNLFQTWQYENGIIHHERMTSEYYISVFGQTTPPTPEQQKLLLIERGLPKFENPEDYNLIQVLDGGFDKFILSQDVPHSPHKRFAYKDMTSKDHLWIILTADVHKTLPDSIYELNPVTLHLCGSLMHKGQTYGWTCDNLMNFEGENTSMRHDFLTPEIRFRSDSVSLGFWLQFGPEIEVSNLQMEVYEHK
ncbi:MAG: hypothetical protein H6582_12700 [Crocinitomicaceae bacterium]|nr:hypothetical protein [Crocinitomicaceae bacterium]